MAKKRYITPLTDIVTLRSPHILLPGSPGCGNDPTSSYTMGILIIDDNPDQSFLDNGSGDFND